MRFLELQLLAYGPFTNHCIDLSGGHEGFHVIHGPNEAGKSTALRALGCLLYDFEHKNNDAFIHKLDQLRVGATLQGVDGTRLSFVRRKGRKDTLLDSEKNPIPESSLARFLSGTTREMFFSRFGIGYRDLREGSNEILAGHGEAGTALVSAGFGGLNIRQVLMEIDQEVEKLFKFRAQHPVINEKIAQYKNIRKNLDSLASKLRETKETKATLESAQEKVKEIKTRRQYLDHEKSRLNRIQAAIPKIARWKDLRARLETYGAVVTLSEDFSERRWSKQQSLQSARIALAEGEAELERLKKEAAGLVVPATILEAKETIEEFKLDLGAFNKELKDQPGLYEAMSRAQIQAEEITKNIPGQPSLQSLMTCELSTSQRQGLDKLAKEYERFNALWETAKTQIAQRTKDLESNNARLAALPPAKNCQGLKVYLEVVTGEGDVEKNLAEVSLAIQKNEEQARIDSSRLPGWKGTLADLEVLNPPSQETVSLYVQRFQEIESQLSDLLGRKKKAERDLSQNKQDITTLLKGGTVPTGEDLQSARAHREQGWSLVRQAWLEGQDITQESSAYDLTHPLPEAYEVAVHHADEIADGLRSEAAKVERLATFQSKQQELSQDIQRITDECRTCEKSIQTAQEEWAILWTETGMTPLSPREMIPWLAKIPPIQQRLEQVRSDRLRLKQLEEIISKHREGLSHHMVELGEREVAAYGTLREARLRANGVVSSIEAVERKREDFQAKEITFRNDLNTAQKNLSAVEAEQAAWDVNWSKAVAPLAPILRLTPHSLADVFRQWDEALRKASEADGFNKRIHQIDEDTQKYTKKAVGLAKRIAPDLAGSSPQEIIHTLYQRLEAAQGAHARRQALEDQTVQAQQSIEKQRTALVELTHQLDLLIHEAGCSKEEELPLAEDRSKAFLNLQHNLQTTERELIEIAPQGDLSSLIREVGEFDQDSLAGSLSTLQEEIQLLENERSEWEQRVGQNGQKLAAINGNDDAAQLAEEAQFLLAGISDDARRFVRLSLASGILREAVERFRKQSQGALLEQAGAIFRNISLGSFTRLETDFGEDDQPILLGVHHDGAHLSVEQMSDGARDQLYLSLRLAHLEASLASQQEKMPLIVDDILVHFDDQRATETLKVLGDLSTKTQVLFFTHHRHLVELAKKALPEGVVFVHELPVWMATKTSPLQI